MDDSYRKLPFLPLNKCKNKKVLDIGSNQGFFAFQAAIHGATSVTGIELTHQDVSAANDIKDILALRNVNFVNRDAVDYVMTGKDKYGLVIMNSVLHQMYPNLEGSSEFLKKISENSEYVAIETPLNHPLMNISPLEFHRTLEEHFKIVRLIYVYDAYSSGYRANFVCYS